MNPLQPRDALGANHTLAHLLLGLDAVAGHIMALANHPDATGPQRIPDDLDFALVGIVALAEHIDRVAPPQHEAPR